MTTGISVACAVVGLGIVTVIDGLVPLEVALMVGGDGRSDLERSVEGVEAVRDG